MFEGQFVNIFGYTGRIKYGSHGYYVNLQSERSLYSDHLDVCIKIIVEFNTKNNKNFTSLGKIIESGMYKGVDLSLVRTSCFFPEFVNIDDLENFIYFLQGNKREKEYISIF